MTSSNQGNQGKQQSQGSSDRGFAGMDSERQPGTTVEGGDIARTSGHAHSTRGDGSVRPPELGRQGHKNGDRSR